MRATRPAQADGTVSEVVGDEIVVWLGTDRSLHLLNPVGAWVWQRLDGTRTSDEIADAAVVLAGASEEAAARAQVLAFIRELARHGLVVQRTAEPAGDAQPAPAPWVPAPFSPNRVSAPVARSSLQHRNRADDGRGPT